MAGINFIDGGEFTPPLKFRTEIEKSCSGKSKSGNSLAVAFIFLVNLIKSYKKC